MQPIKLALRATTGTILILAFLLLPVQTQLRAAENTVGPVAGTVVDAKGNPAAGAVVWMLSGSRNFETQVLAQTVADQQGRFQFDALPWERTSPFGSPLLLTAQDADGRRIGTSGISMRVGNPLPRNCRITLIEGKDYEGRLIDKEGRPIDKAVVQPLLWLGGERSPDTYQYLLLPPVLREKLGAETDADGRFTIRGFAASGTIYARFDAGDFGSPLVKWNLGKPVTVRLSRSGSLQGSLTCAQDAGAAGGVRFMSVGNPGDDQSPEADFSINYFQKGTTRADGTFRLEGIPPGKYSMQLQLPADFPYCVEGTPMVEVKPGQTARIEIALAPAVKVQGKVVDKETKKGVADVRMMLIDYGNSLSRETVTGTDGSFTLHSKPGQIGLYIWQVPNRYITPSWSDMLRVVISAETTIPPITLERAVEVEVIVVDASGKPAPNAEIRYIHSRSRWDVTKKVLHADAAGRVSLGRYSPKDTLIVRARTNAAAINRKKITLRGLRGPVRLVLSEKTTFAIQGTLVDDAGEPIPRADITLIANMNADEDVRLYGTAGNVSLEKHQSDASGNFAFGGLWSDGKYQFLVKIPGHERYASARIDGGGGKTLGLGKIVLARTTHSVSGQIVDSAGKPVAGARVFNSGDGPEPMETVSDAAGNFRLQGFRKGPVYVFAVKQGRRFAGLRTEAGATDARLKMLRDDEPAPKSSVSSTPLSFEEEKKLARALLEKLWAVACKNDKPAGSQGGLIDRARALLKSTLKVKDDGLKKSLIPLMERIDAEQARKWTAECAVKPADTDTKISIKQIAETDLDEALSMLNEDAESAARQLRRLFNHFAKSAPEKALICAEEAIVRVRSLDQPDRTRELISWAGSVIELGQKEAGKKLIEEAAEMTDRWKPSPRNNRSFGQVAVALAPYDSARAIRLLEKISNKSTRENYQAQVAASLDDPAEVESLLKGLNSEAARRARLSLAYRIAPSRPAEALQLIEKYISDGHAEDNAAGQLWRIAKLIGTHDPALTCSLIDRVFEIYLPPEKPADVGDDRAATAARLAVLARKVGYPDMERVIFQTLALRPTPAEEASPVPAMRSVVQMATILALADPASAKQMLLTIEPGIEALDGREGWFLAWAMADPPHAVELAERELAAARQGNAKPDSLGVVRAMADVWTTPPDQRSQITGWPFNTRSGFDPSNPFAP